ncbi:MAG TPA: ORF6N domain-containing protein [Bryobacteraceae bacterium]|nr:ORF6N domain-containing protein [Bryobacteraceae bacterium]
MPKNRRVAPQQGLAVPLEVIERRIYLVRSQKVMLDADLAKLYQVPTKAFNQAVRRNRERFPDDFMFRLEPAEAKSLRSQSVTSNNGRGGSRYLPYVFTEHGVAMLSSVLKSKRAVQMNILIIRAFVRLREMFSTQKAWARRLAKLEVNQRRHASVINVLAEEIEDLKRLPEPAPRQRIGFPR